MGKSFFDQDGDSKETIVNASALTGIDLVRLIYSPDERLNNTEFTQLAMVATGIAMVKAVQKAGLKADVCAGLSLGEYEALYLTGALTEEDAILAVKNRGQFMAEITGGAMSAVLTTDQNLVEEVVSGLPGVWIANYNCPGQIVISGEKEQVEEASRILLERKVKRVLPLKVSGPFHSGLMAPAAQKLGAYLEEVEIHPLEIPYVANVNAQVVSERERVKEYLVEQVQGSVRFEQSIREMIALGVDTFVEIGPGKTLTGFVKKIDKGVRCYNIEEYGDVAEAAKAVLEGK